MSVSLRGGDGMPVGVPQRWGSSKAKEGGTKGGSGSGQRRVAGAAGRLSSAVAAREPSAPGGVPGSAGRGARVQGGQSLVAHDVPQRPEA